MFSLAGKRALVTGIANDRSIAYGCAKAFREQGAEIAVTYLNEKAKSTVRPLAEKLGATMVLPLDVSKDGQFAELFDSIRQHWGRIDICLHSMAFCPREDLHSRVAGCSRAGFAAAMDLFVHSFIRMVRRAEPLMTRGGSCITVCFYGAEKALDNHNIMGPVTAALECVTRCLAAEFSSKGISINALSPGPLKTRGPSGITEFDDLLEQAASRVPAGNLATIEQVGAYAAFRASSEAANVTGGVHYIGGATISCHMPPNAETAAGPAGERAHHEA